MMVRAKRYKIAEFMLPARAFRVNVVSMNYFRKTAHPAFIAVTFFGFFAPISSVWISLSINPFHRLSLRHTTANF